MSWLGKLFKKKNLEQKASIIVLGSSGAGITTLVRYLETCESVAENPRTTLGIDIRQNPINIGGWSLSLLSETF